MSRAKIDCVVIGLGRIGFELSQDPYREKPCTHSEAILSHPRTRLIAGIDPNPQKRKSFHHKTKIPAYSDWKTYLTHHPIPGIVFIATPPASHAEYLRIALKHKIPVAVVEKPITTHFREASALKQAFRQAATRVVVNHERRFADDYVYVRKIIEKKKYGKLLSLKGYFFNGLPFSVATLYHDGTHLFDIADFLTASPKSLGQLTPIPKLRNLQKSFQRKIQSEQDQTLSFTMELNGVPSFFEIGGDKNFFHFELQLFFQKGMLHIGNGIFKESAASPSHYYQGYTSLQRKKKTFPMTHYFINVVKHAVHLYNNPLATSNSSIEDALLIFKVIQKLKLHVAQESLSSGE